MLPPVIVDPHIDIQELERLMTAVNWAAHADQQIGREFWDRFPEMSGILSVETIRFGPEDGTVIKIALKPSPDLIAFAGRFPQNQHELSRQPRMF